LTGNVHENVPPIVIIEAANIKVEILFSVRRDTGSLDRNVAYDNTERCQECEANLFLELCDERSSKNCYGNSCNRQTGHCLPCSTSWSGYICSDIALMYADPIKPVTRSSLIVTVDILVRRTVISNDVYEILDYILNARMVSIEIDVYLLYTIRDSGLYIEC
jgi:hypothetical protein